MCMQPGMVFNKWGASPSVTSVNMVADNLYACLSGGWATTWSLSVSGSLPAHLEYYWEKAQGASSPPSWTFWKTRRTTGNDDMEDANIGSDGGGGSTTRYANARCYVVPVNQGTDQAVPGENDTGTEQSRTANSCAV